MTVTGFMGFAIGLVTVMQVKATSPLTHNISGTAKAAVQVRYTLLHAKTTVSVVVLSSVFLLKGTVLSDVACYFALCCKV
jgi:solute carrier family 35 (GDP-fucose transporter), member C1